MCRSIKPLRHPDGPATAEEVQAAALQFVRKVSNYRTPSQANRAVFDRAVAEIAVTTRRLLDDLVAPRVSIKDTGNPIDSALETLTPMTPAAAALWQKIPAAAQAKLLANVWCSRCSRVTTITHFDGEVVREDLVLTGVCQVCGATVKRLIESA